ncbi:MAG: HNH endonuclease [Trebonia sp.]
MADDDGRALAFAVLRYPRETSTPGLVGEVTLTITASLAAGLNHDEEMRDRARQMLTGLDPAAAGLLEEAITVAGKAAVEAELQAILDEGAGGCAHATEVKAYKVPETMRRWLAARDFTCRYPICRHRARQCDWDHTIPFDRGGRTCPCGLGALCRHHHQLKQAEGWQLSQDRQGHFTWTTPAGLSYRAEPHKYLV